MDSPRKPVLVPEGNKHEDDQEMDRNLYLENPKRSPVAGTKHFMAPTISAASKANPARKKVLAERNEAGDTHLIKTPNSRPSSSDGFRENDKIGASIDDLFSKGKSLGCKSNLTRKKVLGETNEAGDTFLVKTPILGSRSSSCDAFAENENISDLTDDLSSKGVDSLSKFSSPRPQFLRYKPDRLREMVLRRENGAKEGRKEAITPLESDKASIDDLTSDDYDPVRNYLSPRPKFLWYNPNRSREILLRTEDEDKGENEGISSLEVANCCDDNGDLGDKGAESDGISSREAANGAETLLRTENDVKEGDNDGISSLEEADNGNVYDGYFGDNGSVGEEGNVREVTEEIDQSDKEVGEVSESDKEVGEVSESDKEVGKLDESDRETEVNGEGKRDRTSSVEADGNVSESDLESDSEVEQFEESEEKRGWGLKGVSKFLLLLVVLVFCSSFISSMHSTTRSSVLVEFVNSLEKDSLLVENEDTTEISYINLNLLGEVEMDQDVEEAEMQGGENEALDVFEDGELGVGLVGDDREEAVEIVKQDGMGEVDESGGVLEQVDIESGDISGLEVEEMGEVSAAVEDILMQAIKDVEVLEGPVEIDAVGGQDIQLLGATDGLQSQNLVVIEPVKEEMVVIEVGSVGDGTKWNGSPEIISTEAEGIPMDVPERPVEIDAVGSQDIQLPSATDGMESENVVLSPIKEEMVDTSEVLSSEAEGILPGATTAGMKSISVDLSEHIEEEMVDTEEGRLGNIIFGVSLFSSIIGTLVWALSFKSKRTTRKETSPVVNLCAEKSNPALAKRTTEKETSPVVNLSTEKSNPALAGMEDRQQFEHFATLANSKSWTDSVDKYSKEHIYQSKAPSDRQQFEHFATLANPKSWIDSVDKHSKERIYQRRASSVELLGEFMVGEMSTSLRSCGVKSRIVESEEVRNHSVSTGKRMSNNHVQPAFSAISSTENKSVRDWQEEDSEVESRKKASTEVRRSSSRLRKEEDSSSEVGSLNTAATPLRRSSRLRNRGIVSP